MRTTVIKRFRGINRFASVTNLGPDHALDCLNVIVSASGALSKVRVPTALTAAGTVQGKITRIFNFQTPSFNRVVIASGTKLFKAETDTWVVTLLNNEPENAATWDFVTSNNMCFGANGLRTLKLYNNTVQEWGIDPGITAPVLGGTVAGALTFTQGGRSYRYSYKNSVTGHVSKASPVSAYTGNLVAQRKPVTAPGTTDPQVDTLVWWATLDGGGDYFYHSEGPIATLTLVDAVLDTGLNVARRAPLLNDVPPVFKYLAKFQGRIFGFNLVGAKHDFVWSGYEAIREGRPEESFPPSNRARLAIGADEMRGGGVIQAGVIAFSRSNEMFMLRGQVEDVTTDAPIAFTAFMEQLPWNLGTCSHYTGQSTPEGFVWLASDYTIRLFNGSGEPVNLAPGLGPILQRITPGTEENCRAAYYSFGTRQWYALALAVDGSTELNLQLWIDLNPDAQTNAGTFITNFVIGDLAMVEDPDGRRLLVLAMDELLKKFHASDETVNGLSPQPSPTANVLAAFWRGGYHGNESSDRKHMFRNVSLTKDQDGFTAVSYAVDDRNFNVPRVVDHGNAGDLVTQNIKSRRLSFEIRFPVQDTNANILEMRQSIIDLEAR